MSFILSGIGDGETPINKAVVLDVKSCNGGFSKSFNVMVVFNFTNYQPSIKWNTSELKIPANVNLADPFFHESRRIDILIGVEQFFELMFVGQIRLGKGLPTLQKQLFGRGHSWR